MLVAYTVALDLIRQLRPIVEQIKIHDAHLADQLKRAATNTLANLAEGQRRAGGNKRRAYENAHGEARARCSAASTVRWRGAMRPMTRARGSR